MTDSDVSLEIDGRVIPHRSEATHDVFFKKDIYNVIKRKQKGTKRMKKSMCQLGVLVAVAAVVSGCSTFCHEEVNVPLNTVPAVVQSTIQAHTYGGTVDKVEKKTKKCGIVYEAKVKGPDSQCSEIKVSEDGKLLKYETEKKD